jgi:hypothetical protein
MFDNEPVSQKNGFDSSKIKGIEMVEITKESNGQ